MKVAICASEVVPFAKTGGLADVAGALPLALEALNQQVIVIMPRYKAIQDPNPTGMDLPNPAGIGLPKPLKEGPKPFKEGSKFKLKRVKDDISSAVIGKNVQVYFIEKEAYFNRDTLYGDKNGDYPDNLDRFAYYSRRALELLKDIDFKADIIHCHDWQSGLIPVYLKSGYGDSDFFKKTKTVFTIHNIGYQGLFNKGEFPKLGLDWSLFNMEMLEFYDKINVLKGGIVFSDIVNTVSPTYSKEIQTKEFGFGLEGVLNKRRASLFGILNGLDYSIWNPLTDKCIAKDFSEKTIEDKSLDKEDLQAFCKLPVKNDVPLFGVVSRLAEQKGFDIIGSGIEKICKMGLQLVILGTGDLKYHLLLEEIAGKYPKTVSLHLKFDDALAHKIYAGSDLFLMPSKYEPCGLGQLISLRYGTIPLVFKTGGLADTITEKNGFIFDAYKEEALLKTMKEAITAYKNKKEWLGLVRKAMQCDFSWEGAAKNYLRLYEKARAK